MKTLPQAVKNVSKNMKHFYFWPQNINLSRSRLKIAILEKKFLI